MKTMTERRGDWVATYTGRQFWPLDVRPEDLSIHDIARALAFQCRFNGHLMAFYSVAEHCVRVSKALELAGHDERTQLWGLLHDAPEAYIGDMVRPLKRGPGMEEYCRVDGRILLAVAERFGLDPVAPAAVWKMDDALLHAEARDLLAPCPEQWWSEEQAHPDPINPWTPEVAESRFLNRFVNLNNGIT